MNRIEMNRIELAREIASKAYHRQGYWDTAYEIGVGIADSDPAVQTALAMHDHMQAQIDELVEALGDAFADPESLINSEATMNRVAGLLAKHRRAGDD